MLDDVNATPPLWDVLVTAGTAAGVRTAGAHLIRDGANVLFALADDVVARISRAGVYAGPSGSCGQLGGLPRRASRWCGSRISNSRFWLASTW